MGRFREIISGALIVLLVFQVLITSAHAEEVYEVYSLETLPFGEIGSKTEIQDTPISLYEEERSALLDITTHDTLKNGETEPLKNITFNHSGIDDVRVLLSEMREFDKNPLQLEPTFISNPFTSLFGVSSSDSVELLFSTGSIESDAFKSLPMIEGDGPLPNIKGDRVIIDKKSRKNSKVHTALGNVAYQIESGTEIRTASGEIIDMGAIGFAPLSSEKSKQAKTKYEKKMKNRGVKSKGLSEAQVTGFEFGYSGVHLIFSKPVKISVQVRNMTDGMTVDLMTMHAKDADYHTLGLSVSPNTQCNSDGTTTIPGSQAIVKNGEVSFYTCGASSFTMNPSGGTTGSNDLRAIIGDCGQIQLYYNNLTQIYTGNPPLTGCSVGGNMDAWPVLRIGGTSYGNDFSAWTSSVTSGSTMGNIYSATSTMRATVGGLNYDLIIDWRHTAPNKYLTWSWRVVLPVGNTQNVRFYYGMDSAVAGGDPNDTGYYTLTGGQTVGVYDATANVLSAFRYLSGTSWTAYQANAWNTVRTQIASGVDFTNNILSTGGDFGYGVNWDFGTNSGITYSGTVEWRLAPFTLATVPDLIPGIGQPEGPLTVGLTSEMPITISNVGNLSSSGVHTVILTLPANITGPASSFANNGWSCGPQVGTGVTCTKTTIITAPTGEDTVRIPVVPQLAASGTSVTFTTSISNASDGNITNNTAFASIPVVGGPPPNDPGGVTGENLWLRSNNGTNCVATGCTVTTWANQGGLGVAANAVTGLGIVTYDPVNRINGYPTLNFNNASFNTNNNLGLPTRANSIFAVTRIGTGGVFYMGTQTVTNNTRHWATSPTADVWMRYNSTVFYNAANSRGVNTPAITSTVRQAAGASAGYNNGRSILTSASNLTFTVNNFGIGRVGNTNSTLTNLAEVIIYPTAITAAQQKQVESYLAIKYGITLDQTTATNYMFSNGTVMWNAASGSVYNNNITGIARDDTSTLNHTRSQSITNTIDIIVSKSYISNNRTALVWGNNNGLTNIFTATDAPFGYERIAREWQFQEKNGDMGSVTLSYPATSAPSGFTGTMMMLVDADGVFNTGSTAYTGILNAGNWDFTLNIADMQYVTFAKTVPTDTTPPVISSINIASGYLIPKGTFPIVVNYNDTGSSINPASFSGRIYAWDASGSIWSTTDIAGSYLLYSGVPTVNSGGFDISNLPYGKYRFDIVISDTFGNTLTQSYTYFVDEIEWTLSAPLYNIGSVPLGVDTFGTGEYIITVKTVGAGFDLSLLRTADLAYSGQTISVYDGLNGWGYDKDIGSGYSNTITAHGTSQNLISTPKSINPNGQKNTFIYKVKFSINPNANSLAGDYLGNVSFSIGLNY